MHSLAGRLVSVRECVPADALSLWGVLNPLKMQASLGWTIARL